MEPEDQCKTAFYTSLGLYEIKAMPFGLANAPASFERLIETVLRGLQWEECIVYRDDIIVASDSMRQCLDHLEHVFQRLQETVLKLKPSKCSFFRKSVQFLGHVVSENGIHTDSDKIAVVKIWPVPKTLKQVRSFLGICSYYRRFINNFAAMARPLHKLTEKTAKYEWTGSCQQAFDYLKQTLISAPILSYPSLRATLFWTLMWVRKQWEQCYLSFRMTQNMSLVTAVRACPKRKGPTVWQGKNCWQLSNLSNTSTPIFMGGRSSWEQTTLQFLGWEAWKPLQDKQLGG